MDSQPLLSIDCRCGASRREGAARPKRCPAAAANFTPPPLLRGQRNRRDPESAHQGSNAAACGYRTRRQNSHGIAALGDVAVAYAWHPWAGQVVRIHQVMERTTGSVTRCGVVDEGISRAQELPVWMRRCNDCARSWTSSNDHRLLGISPDAIGVEFRWKIGLENRIQHQHRCCHADQIPDGRHTPSELHSAPVDLWVLLKSFLHFIRCADSGLSF